MNDLFSTESLYVHGTSFGHKFKKNLLNFWTNFKGAGHIFLQ